MFEQVTGFILIHVTALKYIAIMPWCISENEVPMIHGFHIQLNDFEKNVFDTTISSCVFFIKNMYSSGSLLKHSMHISVETTQRKSKFLHNSAELKSQFKNSTHV